MSSKHTSSLQELTIHKAMSGGAVLAMGLSALLPLVAYSPPEFADRW